MPGEGLAENRHPDEDRPDRNLIVHERQERRAGAPDDEGQDDCRETCRKKRQKQHAAPACRADIAWDAVHHRRHRQDEQAAAQQAAAGEAHGVHRRAETGDDGAAGIAAGRRDTGNLGRQHGAGRDRCRGAAAEPVAADQQHDAGEADHEADQAGPAQPLARNKQMAERQDEQRHHRHGDSGEARADHLLAPGQKAEGDGVGEQPHAEAVKPDPAPGRGARVRQAGAEQQRHADQQQRGEADPAGSHPQWRQAVKRQLDAEERAAPDKPEKCQQAPVQRLRPRRRGRHQVTVLRA